MQITTARHARLPITRKCIDIRWQNPFKTINNPISKRISNLNFEVRYAFDNQLSIPVWLQYRSGLYTKLPKCSLMGREKCLIVYVTYMFPTRVVLDMEDSIGALTGQPSLEFKTLRDALARTIADNPHANNFSVTIEYRFTEAQIGQHEDGFYSHELDVMFSLTESFPTVVHPYGDAGLRLKDLIDNQIDDKSACYSVYIIDNEGLIGDRFVRFGNDAFKVPIIRDDDRDSGVYIVSSPYATSAKSNDKFITSTLTIAEADKIIPLHKNAEDAMSHENAVHEAMEQKLKILSAMVKHTELSIRNNLNINEEKRYYEQIQEEHKRRYYEERKEQQHDERQDRKHFRNEILEYTKLAVTLASLAFTLFKLKSNKG